MFIALPFILFTSFFSYYTRGNLIYKICRIWADVGMFLWGIRVKIVHETPNDVTKPYIFTFNHLSYIDAPVIVKSIRKHHFRALGKVEISGIPIFGYIYKSAVIMVRRENKEDRARSVSDLKAALDQNISIALAPEGTFNMTNKPLEKFYDGAFRIAIETKTSIKPLLILDSYDRMHYRNMFTMNPGKLRVVFLEEISPEGYDLSELELLKQKVYLAMEAALIKYKASWIN
jgi:1-acyl-sn-glycerol-3-phosphate acyltransferase